MITVCKQQAHVHICVSLKIRAIMAGAVKFTGDSMPKNSEGRGNQENERTKFLTMKYGQQQIKLIQKRLKVEFWMDEQLNKLYEISVSHFCQARSLFSFMKIYTFFIDTPKRLS